jgi:Uma2 family endonuclease
MNSPVDSWPRKQLITVDEYHKMAKVGPLAPDARVELIEGEIIDMAPIGNLQAGVLNRLNRLFATAAGDRVIVQPRGPVLLDKLSMTQPDLALLALNRTFYGAGLPMPADTLLVAEISDGTVAHDRNTKIPMLMDRLALVRPEHFFLFPRNYRPPRRPAPGNIAG